MAAAAAVAELPFLWLLSLPPPLLPLLGRKLNMPLASSATAEDMEERGW